MEENKKKVFWFTLVLGVMLGLMALVGVSSAAVDGYEAVSAGTVEANGIYCPVGTFNGQTKYQNESAIFLNYYTAGATANLWVISAIDNNDAGNVDYYHEATPQGTYSLSSGQNPVPVLTLAVAECAEQPALGLEVMPLVYFGAFAIFFLGFYMVRLI